MHTEIPLNNKVRDRGEGRDRVTKKKKKERKGVQTNGGGGGGEKKKFFFFFCGVNSESI